MSVRGSRPCSMPVPLDDEETVRLVLARYSCVEDVRRVGDRLHWSLDLARTPLDGMAMEEVVARAIQKTIALHRAPSEPPGAA